MAAKRTQSTVVEPTTKAAKTPASSFDIKFLLNWTTRLEDSLERLALATTELTIGVAAHKQRLDNVEERYQDQVKSIHEIVARQATDTRDLNERITAVQTDLTSKLIEQTNNLTEHFDDAVEKLSTKVDDRFGQLHRDILTVDKRVGTLEKWRSALVGGAIVIGFIISGIVMRIVWVLLEPRVFDIVPLPK
jgi:DNA anti-recombination protein RmuC